MQYVTLSSAMLRLLLSCAWGCWAPTAYGVLWPECVSRTEWYSLYSVHVSQLTVIVPSFFFLQICIKCFSTIGA